MKKILTVLGCLAFLFSLHSSEIYAAKANQVEVTQIKGLVKIKQLGKREWKKADENAILTSGDQIRSYLESSAVLIFPDKSEFTLGENSSLDIKDVSQNPRTKQSKRELKLNLGSLKYKVPPKEETAAEFKIHSSTSIVGITGTEGIIIAEGEDQPTENILIEGSTYNTDENGDGGTFQTEGNVYHHDGEHSDMYGSDAQDEANQRGEINPEYEAMVNNLVAQFEAKRLEGFDVAEVSHLIEGAFQLLENRDYDRVREIVDQALALLEQSQQLDIPEEIGDQIDEIVALVDAKENEGYDVSELHVLLEQIHQLITEQNYDGIEGIIVQISQKMETLTMVEEGEQEGADEYLTYYQQIMELVLEKESQGFALDEIKSMLRQSYSYYENGGMSTAFQLLEQARDSIQLTLKEATDALIQRLDVLAATITAKGDEGFSVEELSLMMQEVYRLVEQEAFLSVQEMIAQVEETLLTLQKRISADWEIKLSTLREEIEYKESIGYDLSSLNDLLQALQDAVESADETNLETIYNQVMAALDALGVPEGFEAEWQAFLAALQEKEALGFNVAEIINLRDRIGAALDAGDINLARSFLAQAKDKLDAIVDNEPPTLQVLTFEQTPEMISVEGYASDNTQLESVTVNNLLVAVDDEGKFNYSTVPVPDLTTITLVAMDISGNASPPISLTVEVESTVTDVVGDLTNVNIEYLAQTFIVKGQFIPGGLVTVAGIETHCDGDSNFNATLDPTDPEIGQTIAVVGTNTDGTTTSEMTLTVEDKWIPKVIIDDVYFTDTVAPTLTVNPLSYTDTSANVSGQVNVSIMANIEGEVSDIGGTIASLTVNGKDVQVGDNGKFTASFALAPEIVSAQIIVADDAGNSTEDSVTFDAALDPPSVKVNEEEAVLNNEGQFDQSVILTKEMTEIVVALLSHEGEQITVKRLPVASILPPDLEITDINIVDDVVTVTGTSDPQVEVTDQNQALFAAPEQTGDDGTFTMNANAPTETVEVVLIATNIEGKVSQPATITIEPPQDEHPPRLFISSPQFSGDNVTISGFVEDESPITSFTIANVAVDVSPEGQFFYEMSIAQDMTSFSIVATDSFGNVATEIIAVEDTQAPVITIDTWDAQNGRLVIAGSARDNVAMKEIRLNEMPIIQSQDAEVTFSYEGALTEESNTIVLFAVDMFGNETQVGPRAIEIPVDTTPPQGVGISLEYGSPVVYVSGSVNDPGGIKSVYINGEEAEVFDDGSFSVKLDVAVDPPAATLETPAYDNGIVTIAGKVSVGQFTPAKVTVEAEDLAGNRGIVFSQEVSPYTMAELNVIVDGTVVALDETGAFSHAQGIELGKKSLEIEIIDPFENRAMQAVDLEITPPLLELNELVYNAEEKTVVVTGKAQDAGSGLYTITINGIRVDFDDDGIFNFIASISESSLGIVAKDFIGNVTSLTKEVKPPDIWPPVFNVAIKPMPAIIGKTVYVEIASVDSQNGVPDLLSGPPTVNADINGTLTPLSVDGEGANFIATLDTTGLTPSIINVSIQGSDAAGNTSTKIEGDSVVTLVADDAISPSFTIEAIPAPLLLGEASVIKAFASEEMLMPPTLEAVLPSGEVRALELTKVSGQEFETSLTVDLEVGVGQVSMTLSGGEDLSGNLHETTTAMIDVVAPVQDTEIPLNVDFIEFVPDRFTVKGKTASEAVVQLQAGEHTQDIIADVEGKFSFVKPISPEELAELYAVAPTIAISLKAHTYAGFESPQRVFDIALPPMPEIGGENFNIMIQPMPPMQGDMINFNIDVLNPITEPIRGLLYLPDGQRMQVPLSGDRNLNGQFQLAPEVIIGPAQFEVIAGNIRESVPFEIVLSDEWMQRLNKDEFFNVRVMPDPVFKGQEAVFNVDTLGDLDVPPQLQLMLPDGSVQDVVLGGGPRNFSGQYFCPPEMPSGRAEIILNPGTPEEVRRPFGVEDEFGTQGQMDAFLFANPQPLLGGEPFDVQVSFPMPIDFMPQLILKLSDGEAIEIPLEGGLPSNRFSANGKLKEDAAVGLAKFVLKDDQGNRMGDFPTHVTPPLTSAKGVNVFMVPDIVMHGDHTNIQLNAQRPIPADEKLEAHVGFEDGSKVVVPLFGQEMMFNGNFMVPDEAPFGMITVSVMNKAGEILGASRGEIVDHGHHGGMVNVFLSNHEFGPNENVKLGVDAPWPLPFVPKAELIWNGGNLKINLRGKVPGNRFGGEFVAPGEILENARIEVRDDLGSMIGDIPLDQRGPGGDGDIMITPMPPMMGQPLSIKVTAPEIVDTAPMMRLIFSQGGSRELNAYGALPGDTFTASLDMLKDPLDMIEIVHDGQVVAAIPVGGMDGGPMEFDVEPQGELMPGALIDLVVRARRDVPFVPRLSVDFQGNIVDVPLSGMPFTREFFGKATIPATASLDGINLMIYDPQGGLMWQRVVSGDPVGGPGGFMVLNVMPSGEDAIDLSWDMVRGVDFFEVRYGETPAVEQRVEVRGNNFFKVEGLQVGMDYFFQVAAFMGRNEIMSSDVIPGRAGATRRELFVQDMVMGQQINLMWADYPGAQGYRVEWGMNPGNYDQQADISSPGFMIMDLVMGNTYFIKVFAVSEGQPVGESREIVIRLDEFMAQGVDIMFEPDQPQQGQDLIVRMHFFDDLPFIPSVIARMQGGDIWLEASGDKRDFEVTLFADQYTSQLHVIDVMDPQGRMIGSRGVGDHGGMGGPMVPIMTQPDMPAIGDDVFVKVEFPDPVPFTPELILEMASGQRRFMFPQGPNQRVYELNILGAEITSSLMRAEVIDPMMGMMVAEKFFGGGGPGMGPGGVFIQVFPDPSNIGQSVDVSAEFGFMLPFVPRLIAEFEDGSRFDQFFPGNPGQSTYSMMIPPERVNSNIRRIEIQDDRGMFIGDWFSGGAGTGGPGDMPLVCNPAQPMVGMPFDCNVNVPGEPVPMAPRLKIVYMDGSQEELSMFGNIPGNSFVYQLASLPFNIDYIDLINPMTGEVKYTWQPGAAGPGPGTDLNIMTNCAGPGQQLDVSVQFAQPVPYVPRMRIELEGGMRLGPYTFPQPPNMNMYSMMIPPAEITGNVFRIEIEDDRNMFLKDFMCQGGGGSGGGVIDFVPDPPMMNQDLIMIARLQSPAPSDLEFFVEFTDGSRTPIYYSNIGPGLMEYSMTIPAADMMGSEGRAVVDSPMGVHLERAFGGTGPGPQQCNIMVDMDPPMMNQPLTVTADFPQPLTETPTLFVELADGQMKYFPFPQAAGMMSYQIGLPATEITADVVKMEIQGNMGTYCLRYFGGSGPMPQQCNIMLDFNPPVVGQPLNIRAEFPGPAPEVPWVEMDFNGRGRYQSTFPQGPNMTVYEMSIPASEITNEVIWLGIKDTTGQLCDMPLGGGGSNANQPNIVFDCPSVGQDLIVRAEFPQTVFFTPSIMVELDGAGTIYESFPQGPGLNIYEITITGDRITAPVMRVEIKDDMGNFMHDVFCGGVNPSNFTCAAMFNPNPPVPFQDLQVTADYGTTNMPSYTPNIYIEFDGGGFYQDSFGGGPYQSMYTHTIPGSMISNNVIRLGFGENNSSIDCGMDFTMTGPQVNITVNPDPPQPFQDLNVTAMFDQYVYFSPKLDVQFMNGPPKMYTFPQAPGMQQYDLTIPSSDMTDNVEWMEVQDDQGNPMPQRKSWGTASTGPTVTIQINPDPPTPGNPLDVTMNFSSAPTYTPKLIIEFTDSSEKSYLMSGPGQMTYNFSIPNADMTGEVAYIWVENDQAQSVPNELSFGGGETLDVSLNIQGNDQIEVCWTNLNWVDEFQIHYRDSAGVVAESPKVVSGMSCYTLDNTDGITTNETYYIKVEAWMNGDGSPIKESPERDVYLSSSTVAPPASIWADCTGIDTEIRVMWDQENGVDGYKVYFGTSPGSYTYSGSPEDVTGESTTDKVLTSLSAGTPYYIIVRSYIGATESNDSNEIIKTCGGDLSTNPTMLNLNGTAGSSIAQETITVNNGGATNEVVRFIRGSLMSGGNTISETNIAVNPASQTINASSSENFTVDITVPGGTADGNYGGGIQFYVDGNNNGSKDAGETITADLNIAVIVGSVTVDHFDIVPQTSQSSMGEPIAVLIHAEDNADAIVDYDGNVNVMIDPIAGGNLRESWILSFNGGPGGMPGGQVTLFDGMGVFTIDSTEPKQYLIDIDGTPSSNNPEQVAFTSALDNANTATDWIIVGPSTATGGSGTTDGAWVWVAAVDGSGNVDTDYSGGNPTVTVDQGAVFEANGTGSISPTLTNGQVQLQIQCSVAGCVSTNPAVNASGTLTGAAPLSIDFDSVGGFIVSEGGGSHATAYSTTADEQHFVVRASTIPAGGTTIRGYHKEGVLVGMGAGLGSATVQGGGTMIRFTDGIAEFALTNSVDETVEFQIQEDGASGINSGGTNITVDYQNPDNVAPGIRRVEVENPWLIHLYFDEDLDSTTGGTEANYRIFADPSGANTEITSTLYKVCWYGDHVTLHLDTAITGTSVGVIVDAVEDNIGNAMSNVTSPEADVPGVDTQGQSGQATDWLEIQVSETNPAAGGTIMVKVFHKNVCGYLSGSNRTNMNTNVTNVDVTFTGGTVTSPGGNPHNVGLTDGEGEFALTATGAVTLTAAGSGVTTRSNVVVNF